MSLSNIEATLTKHIRSFLTKNYSTDALKVFACIVSLISCLCAGSVLLFPLFTPVLSHRLGYSQFQINIVGSLTSIGMYLPLPVLGYLADCHGPIILSVITLVLFGPSYQFAAYIVDQNLNFWLLAITFGFVGCATSALYFTALLTCAKIYPKNKGLTISAPVTCYGLSSLIGSQILKLDFLQAKVSEESELNLYKTFKLFSILYIFLGIFNWLSASVVSIERDILLRKHETSEQENNEERPLLSDSNEDYESYGDGDDLVANHKSKFMKFLKDISTYILLFSVLLSIGPSEMYITNMGSLINTISPKSLIPNQVSVHAVFSTLSRLTLGGLSDFLVAKYRIPRSSILLVIIILGLITQVFIASSIFIQDQYYIISALSGFSYGGLFTLYPTVILSIWGSEIFGSAWGSFMIAPAIGSTTFGMIFGLFYDRICQIGTNSFGSGNCISSVFWINSLSFAFSALFLIIAWKGIWEKRGYTLS